MVTWQQIEAAGRRQHREAQKRQRELARRAKEQDKQSAEEQAQLEVETYENRLEVALSIHKEQADSRNWPGLAASLPPPCPRNLFDQEQRVRQRLLVLSPQQRENAETMIAMARSEDEQKYREAMSAYGGEKAHWEKMRGLARRVLAGDHKAYIEALVELSPLAEISDLGSFIKFTVHTAKLIEAELKVSGTQAIPAEIKSLTTSGKLSVKPMPKGRFHETYQDYVCGCILRVAREVFALLPVETLLITACVDVLDSSTGQNVEQPVVSVVMHRPSVDRLNFDTLDPSDSLENFQHRSNFKASRKTEAFLPIQRLTFADITPDATPHESLDTLLSLCRKIRVELDSRIVEVALRSSAPPLETT